jgi:subtilisin family serine protease
MHPDYVVPEQSLSSPADAVGAFAVGAVNWADDVLEPYSSQGPTADGRIKPDLAAPSVVDSASYAPEAFDGTSAATPHVAGAAALVLQAFPDFTPADIAQFLQERAEDLGDAGPDNAFGMGRLDLEDAPAGTEPAETPISTEAEPAETPTSAEVAEILPTSTPRPPLEVGLPGQTGLPPQGSSGTQTESSSLSLIIGVGFCLLCLGGLLFLGLLVAGFFVMRRKK